MGEVRGTETLAVWWLSSKTARPWLGAEAVMGDGLWTSKEQIGLKAELTPGDLGWLEEKGC